MPEVIARLYKQLSVQGVDAGEFLQGQLTQDIASVPLLEGLPAAWCNARGRVVATLRVFARDDGFDLMLPASIATSVCSKLQMYVLRSKVALSINEGSWNCMVSSHDNLLAPDELPENILRVKATEGIDYHEYFAPVERSSDAAECLGISTEESLWKREMLRGGRVVIDEVSSEKYTPHMLNLDKTGAISFGKGCYTGQEIVARTENLGKSRRRLAYFTGAPEACRNGDKLFEDASQIGDIVNVADGELLAVLPTVAHQSSVIVNDTPLTPGKHLAAD